MTSFGCKTKQRYLEIKNQTDSERKINVISPSIHTVHV